MYVISKWLHAQITPTISIHSYQSRKQTWTVLRTTVKKGIQFKFFTADRLNVFSPNLNFLRLAISKTLQLRINNFPPTSVKRSRFASIVTADQLMESWLEFN